MIPNVYHFVFGLRKQTEPFHLAHYLCLESCRQVNRPAAIRFSYHYEPYGPYWDRIRPHLDLIRVDLNRQVGAHRYAARSMAQYRYAHHSDFIRLERLLEEGGVYAEMDTLFVRPLPEELFARPFVLGSENQPGTLCNAVILSEPGAEFGRRWLARMSEAFTGDWNQHSCRLPYEIAREIPEAIHVEPPETFYPFPATLLGLAGLLYDRQPIPEQTCSVHLWAHLWWSRSRIDFSMFHGGQITPDFVRSGGTTLAQLARPFLPSDAPPQMGTWRGALDAAVTGLGGDLKAVAGVTLLPLLRLAKPGVGRLNLARGRLAAISARRHFSFQSPFEEGFLESVIRFDEYGIFEGSFRPDDVILDVGGHLGLFTYACHRLGSRNIHAFEPYPPNFARLKRHAGELPGVTLHPEAVFRSDRPAAPLRHSGPAFANTGAGNVIFDGAVYRPETASFLPNVAPASASEPVSTIALDRILAEFPTVKLLKLDCEGSEFPILLTSQLLARVERITGEYHETPEEHMPRLAPDARVDGVRAYTIDLLADRLRDCGFEVSARVHSGGLGMFHAVRRGL